MFPVSKKSLSTASDSLGLKGDTHVHSNATRPINLIRQKKVHPKKWANVVFPSLLFSLLTVLDHETAQAQASWEGSINESRGVTVEADNDGDEPNREGFAVVVSNRNFDASDSARDNPLAITNGQVTAQLVVFKDFINLNRQTNITGATSITGATTLSTTLRVNGTSTTNGITNTGDTRTTTLNVTGNGIVGGTLGVTGATTLRSTLGVTGLSTTNGIINNGDTRTTTLNVTGNTTTTNITNSGLIETQNLTVHDNTTLNGSLHVEDTLNVEEATTLNSTLSVTGNTTTTNITNSGDIQTATLNVTGLSTTNGITNTGNIINNGDTRTTTLNVTGNGIVGGTLGVTGAATLDSTLLVEDATTLNSTLSVAGLSTTNGITNTGNIINNGDTRTTTLNVTGNGIVGGTLGVTGAATLDSTLNVAGSTRLGNDSTDTTTVTGSLNVVHGDSGFVVDNDGLRYGLANSDVSLDLSRTGFSLAVGENSGHIDVTDTRVALFANAGPGRVNNGFIADATTGVTSVTGESTANIVGGSTTLAVSSTGVHLSNPSTQGGTVRISGVAPGVAQTDAVNVFQLGGLEGKLSKGIASTIAMSQIPLPSPGNNFSLGVGTGSFNGENSVAVGITGRTEQGVTFRTSFSHSDEGITAFGAGVGFSW